MELRKKGLPCSYVQVRARGQQRNAELGGSEQTESGSLWEVLSVAVTV